MSTGSQNLHTAKNWCTVWQVGAEGQTCKIYSISVNISKLTDYEHLVLYGSNNYNI